VVCLLDPEHPPIRPTGSRLGDALSALGYAAAAARRRTHNDASTRLVLIDNDAAVLNRRVRQQQGDGPVAPWVHQCSIQELRHEEGRPVSDRPRLSSSEQRAARDAARKGDKVRRRALEQAMLAGWSDEDADEANWLDEVARAHPGPDAAVGLLDDVAVRLVDRLAEATGEDREQVLRSVLRQS
jgi:hypothetical protein